MNKFKSYSFWLSVAGAVVLVINTFGEILGFSIDGEIATKIVDSVCGVLVLFGIITMPKDKNDADTKIDNTNNSSNKDETKNSIEANDKNDAKQ